MARKKPSLKAKKSGKASPKPASKAKGRTLKPASKASKAKMGSQAKKGGSSPAARAGKKALLNPTILSGESPSARAGKKAAQKSLKKHKESLKKTRAKAKSPALKQKKSGQKEKGRPAAPVAAAEKSGGVLTKKALKKSAPSKKPKKPKSSKTAAIHTAFSIQAASAAKGGAAYFKEELKKIQSRRQKKASAMRALGEKDYCAVENCDQAASAGDYCRLHYIGCWEDIQAREGILKTAFIEKSIQAVLKASSPAMIMCLIGDFQSEKSFAAAMKSLLEHEESVEEDRLIKELVTQSRAKAAQKKKGKP